MNAKIPFRRPWPMLLLLLGVLVAAPPRPVRGEEIRARLVGALQLLPAGGITPLEGPLLAPHPPVPLTASLRHRHLPLGEIRALTGVGATSITFPRQGIHLDATGEMFNGSLNRPCLVTHYDTLSGAPNHELEAVTVRLSHPVPDLGEGDCVVVTGHIDVPARAKRSRMTILQALPTVPLPPLLPGVPIPLMPEFYKADPMDGGFEMVTTQPVRVQLCGKGTRTRVGRLDYTLKQKGSTWAWNYRGAWNVTISDNGFLGENHRATLVHESVENTFEGDLIAVLPGALAMIADQRVERVNDPEQEELFEQDPATGTPPEAIEYRVDFDNPGPGLADKMTLRFNEPMPVTGKVNQLEVNHPAVLALGHWFRASGNPGFVVSAPVTGEDSVDVSSFEIPAQSPVQLELRWTLP